VSLLEGIEIAAHSTRNLWACFGGLEGFFIAQSHLKLIPITNPLKYYKPMASELKFKHPLSNFINHKFLTIGV
jgi:hypothetical protein